MQEGSVRKSPKQPKGEKKQKSTYELGSQKRRWAEAAAGDLLLSQLTFSLS